MPDIGMRRKFLIRLGLSDSSTQYRFLILLQNAEDSRSAGRRIRDEGTWGKPRTILLMDGVEDIIPRYLDVRKQKLEECGKTSDSLFPPIQNENEFYCQQKFCNLKKCVETIVGEKFELRAGRRSYDQRLLNKGNRVEDVSVAMGHCSTRTTELYYARA